jgi:hypothetical protein
VLGDPGSSLTSSRVRRAVGLAHLGVGIFLAVWLWWKGLPEAAVPRQWADSSYYLGQASGRPWFIVGWWRLWGPTSAAIAASYTLSVACWARLGWVTLGAPGVYLAVLLAGADLIRSWHWCVLSEGVAWSGLALLAAETVAIERRPTSWAAGRWLVAIVLNTARVVNGVAALPTAVVIWSKRYRAVALAGVLVALSPLWQEAGTEFTAMQRDSIVLGRVPRDPAMLAWFTAHGMPWPVDSRWTSVAFPDREQLRQAEPGFLEWVDSPAFHRTYLGYLIAFPEKTLRDAVTAFAGLSPLPLYAPGHGRKTGDMLWTWVNSHVGVLSIIVASLALGVPWVAWTTLAALLAAYEGAAWEVERHLIVVAVWECAALFVLAGRAVQLAQRAFADLKRRHYGGAR